MHNKCCYRVLHTRYASWWAGFWIRYATAAMTLLLLSLKNVSGQDIILQNPSLEGNPQRGTVPKPWYIESKTPDTQPGFEISLPPSNGNSYIGALHSNDYYESFAQDMETSLKAGKIYYLTFDLAYPPYYTKEICNGSFAIYGTNPNESPVLLWESGAFYHTGWKTYTAILKPKKEYHQIILGPNYVAPCSSCNCTATAVLIDNFSTTIREMPQLEVHVQNTCKNMEKGAVTVTVRSGVPPFHYFWSSDINGSNHDSNELHNLKAGAYNVTVVGGNGLEVRTDFNIGEMDIQVTPEITPPSCYGYNDAVVNLAVISGIPPYHYEMNYGAVIQNQPVFTQLKKGPYKFKITDARGCTTPIYELQIPQPDLLQMSVADVQPACSDDLEGKIVMNCVGGVPPYVYSLDRSRWQASNSFEQLSPGKYLCYITDKNKCEISDRTEIKKNNQKCAIFMPNAFSPNGDGLNDTFRPKVYDEVHDFAMEIFNRYGQRIYVSRNPKQGWDGGQQPSGAYIWTITYMDSKLQARKQQGSITLIR